MATLSIRNLPDDVHAKLRIRAARAGRSIEAEVRQILVDSIVDSEADPGELLAFVRDLYGGELPSGVVDELIADRRREGAKE